jgi:hypothetical protein
MLVRTVAAGSLALARVKINLLSHHLRALKCLASSDTGAALNVEDRDCQNEGSNSCASHSLTGIQRVHKNQGPAAMHQVVMQALKDVRSKFRAQWTRRSSWPSLIKFRALLSVWILLE